MTLMTPDLATLKRTIEDALHHHLPTSSPIAQVLLDAMRYASLSGGKRIRPLLVCATCTGLGGALEDALLEFAGSALVISHDRWFLDRIATHILSFEGDSQVAFFTGNYQEYEADKKKRLGEEAARPKRIRYKPLKI